MLNKHQRRAVNKAICQRISLVICLNLLISSCESNKLSQCEQIYSIARNLNQSNKNFDDVGNEQFRSMKGWLQAANRFSQAAENMKALKVDRRELIQYQSRLARIYRVYARATHDAVRARENSDLSVLDSARKDAIQAGIIQRQLVREIDAFCLEAE